MAFTLGFFSASHLGDAMCTTTLPRKIYQHFHKKVFIVDHPSTAAVFANNPYIAGFRNEGKVLADSRTANPYVAGARDKYTLANKIIAHGHIIQRLELGFKLSVEPVPKPELYFSAEELKWAQTEKEKWPQDKPICILCAECITDERFESYTNLDWQQIVELLCNHYTIIRPIITCMEYYHSKDTLSEGDKKIWMTNEQVKLDHVILYSNLPIRHYLALFTNADCYCGTPGGGMHAAAALSIPSLVILNRKSCSNKIKFPNKEHGLPTEAFLYPQHTFIRTDDLYAKGFNRSYFSMLMENMIDNNSFQGASILHHNL